MSAENVRDDELLDEDVSTEDVSATQAVVNVAPVLSVGPADARDSDAPVLSNGLAEPRDSDAPVLSVGPADPRDVDFPDFQRGKTGKKTFAALVGSAVVLVGASVAWSQFASPRKAPAAAVAAREPERRAPERAPEPASPAPVPSPATPVPSEGASAPAPTLEGAAATPLEKAVTTVAVTIKTVPEESVIFRAGQRLGSGVVEVSVERNTKQRFTALHDGYTPSNFTLDGSRDSVTIRLKRMPKREAAPAPASDSHGDEPNSASNVATDPAPTAAPPSTTPPAPESTTPAAPSPEVSPPASPSE